MRGRVWRAGQLQPDFVFDRISDYLTEEQSLVWVDLYDPDAEALRELATELGLNAWAVEDAVDPSERVKTTVYADHTFFTVYAVEMAAPEPGAQPKSLLTRHRISAFVLDRALVTVRLPPQFDFDEVVRRWDDLGVPRYGVGGLVHGLLDVVVDGHFEAVQELDDNIEGLADELFNSTGAAGSQRAFQHRSFQLRKDLLHLRRLVLPMREVVGSMQHHPHDFRHPVDLNPYYVDLYDHVLRVSEWTESLRDMVTTVFETNLSLQDARLNTVMKKLTGWAAIVAVPTAITGFYGQNVPYPGYGLFSGFLISSLVMLTLVLTLYVMFRRRDWL